MARTSVLFVCMGNICRSPMAEAVFRAHVEEAGLSDEFHIDSAGTHSYHVGSDPHPETQAELTRRGIPVGQQTSRLVTAEDLDEFDYVVAMDRENLEGLQELRRGDAYDASDAHAELSLLLEHAATADTDEVPDPYYVGGYDRVYDLVEAGSRGLLAHITAAAR